MNIHDSLNKLRLELLQRHPSVSNFQWRSNRQVVVERIENITLDFIKKISKGEVPYFESLDFNKFGNCLYNERLQLKQREKLKKKKKISFGKLNGRSKFAVIAFLLSKIHKLLITSRTSTRRELYYGNLNIFKSQADVDDALRDISFLLNSPPWELGVLSTAKGLVAGPLIFKSDDEIINCKRPGGVLIPQNILEVELMSTSIQWALVVEKDAVFQNLLDEDGLSKLKECLFITGKGFPDINTRLLICRLWECFKIPILALVDADPYGLEIMCVYRFGSVNFSVLSDHLACPSMRWLGVHPSDIKLLGADHASLSNRDARKISRLASRPYIKENKKILDEVQILIDENIKAEIEGISNISPRYLTDIYIPSKINANEFL